MIEPDIVSILVSVTFKVPTWAVRILADEHSFGEPQSTIY